MIAILATAVSPRWGCRRISTKSPSFFMRSPSYTGQCSFLSQLYLNIMVFLLIVGQSELIPRGQGAAPVVLAWHTPRIPPIGSLVKSKSTFLYDIRLPTGEVMKVENLC